MIEAQINKKNVGETKFPKLMMHTHNGTIVLMKAMNSMGGIGVCVYNHVQSRIGEYAENWAVQNFVDYDGEVVLRNGSEK